MVWDYIVRWFRKDFVFLKFYLAMLLVSVPLSSCAAQSKLLDGGKPHPHAADRFSSMIKHDSYQDYLDFFEKVYDVVDKNYYHPVFRADFDRF